MLCQLKEHNTMYMLIEMCFFVLVKACMDLSVIIYSIMMLHNMCDKVFVCACMRVCVLFFKVQICKRLNGHILKEYRLSSGKFGIYLIICTTE